MSAWQTVALGSVCELVNGRAFKPSDWGEEGIPIVRIQNLNDPDKPFNCFAGDVRERFLIDSGDILLSWSGTPGTSFGCFVWTRGKAILNQHIFRVFVDTHRMDQDFFVHAVNSKLDEMIALAHGGVGLRHITKGKLEGIMLPLPELEEQRRIVTTIRECLDRIAEIRDLRAASAREAAAVFPQVLRARFEDISKTNAETPLEAVSEIVGGQSLPKGVDEDPGDALGVLLFKVGDMNLDGNELCATTAREYAVKGVQGRIVPPGAVVFPKRGGAIATNKKRLLGRPAILDPNLMAVVPDTARLRPAYLLAWCENLDLRDLSNGGVIPQLNKKDLAPLTLPVPSLAEQDEILLEVEQAREAASELYAKVRGWSEETDLVRRAVLRRALAGEL